MSMCNQYTSLSISFQGSEDNCELVSVVVSQLDSDQIHPSSPKAHLTVVTSSR